MLAYIALKIVVHFKFHKVVIRLESLEKSLNKYDKNDQVHSIRLTSKYFPVFDLEDSHKA